MSNISWLRSLAALYPSRAGKTPNDYFYNSQQITKFPSGWVTLRRLTSRHWAWVKAGMVSREWIWNSRERNAYPRNRPLCSLNAPALWYSYKEDTSVQARKPPDYWEVFRIPSLTTTSRLQTPSSSIVRLLSILTKPIPRSIPYTNYALVYLIYSLFCSPSRNHNRMHEDHVRLLTTPQQASLQKDMWAEALLVVKWKR